MATSLTTLHRFIFCLDMRLRVTRLKEPAYQRQPPPSSSRPSIYHDLAFCSAKIFTTTRPTNAEYTMVVVRHVCTAALIIVQGAIINESIVSPSLRRPTLIAFRSTTVNCWDTSQLGRTQLYHLGPCTFCLSN